MTSTTPLLDDIRRLSHERDLKERQLQRVRTGILAALAVLSDRPERR